MLPCSIVHLSPKRNSVVVVSFIFCGKEFLSSLLIIIENKSGYKSEVLDSAIVQGVGWSKQPLTPQHCAATFRCQFEKEDTATWELHLKINVSIVMLCIFI